MELPKKIHPNPIIDALVEIRFTSDIHSTAVFGIIYQALKDDYPHVENLPILQIPEQLRSIDSNFRFKPHFKIRNDHFSIQIGPDVISIASFPDYSGWSCFSESIFGVLNKLKSSGVIKEVLRLGIRYINFFETEIFSKLKIKISIDDNPIEYRNTVFKSDFLKENFTATIQVANNVNFNDKFGSVIDIDTSLTSQLEGFFEKKESLINDGHQIEKELFFSLMNESFLNSLNPEY
jgi:uncharacterized protein (TIGR04255 family)